MEYSTTIAEWRQLGAEARARRRSVRLHVWVAAFVTVLGLVFCSSASAESLTEASQAGQTAAVLSYELAPLHFTASDPAAPLAFRSSPYVRSYSDFRVAVVRRGRRLVSQNLGPTCSECTTSPGGRRRSIRVRDLTGDGEPEVIVDLYTYDWSRSDHAYYYSYVYSYVAEDNGGTGGYRRATGRFGWRNANYRLRDLGQDGKLEFVDEDDRFALAFSLSGDSRFPIRIWRIENRHFQNVTKRYPRTVARHARRMWQTYRRQLRQRSPVDSALGTYMADLYLIDRGPVGWKHLRRLASSGLLYDYELGGDSWTEYLRYLKRFLRRTGYAR